VSRDWPKHGTRPRRRHCLTGRRFFTGAPACAASSTPLSIGGGVALHLVSAQNIPRRAVLCPAAEPTRARRNCHDGPGVFPRGAGLATLCVSTGGIVKGGSAGRPQNDGVAAAPPHLLSPQPPCVRGDPLPVALPDQSAPALHRGKPLWKRQVEFKIGADRPSGKLAKEMRSR
jgi:hypothetical protein